MMRMVRLGDDIDDFCVKCKRVMNHSVVSILNDAPAKVRCRTCHSDHDFRNEQPPPPKVDSRKAALFNEVLGNVAGLPTAAAAPPDGKPAEAKSAKAAAAQASAGPAESKVKVQAKAAGAQADGAGARTQKSTSAGPAVVRAQKSTQKPATAKKAASATTRGRKK